jgi:hypothetical protein
MKEALMERKAIYERVYPETKAGGLPGKAGGGKVAKNVKITSFAESTAKVMDISRSAVR